MKCKLCGKECKNMYCCDKHRYRYHNIHNPRGVYAYLAKGIHKGTQQELNVWEIPDDHSFEEDEMGIH